MWDLHQMHLASSSVGSIQAHMVELARCHGIGTQFGTMDLRTGSALSRSLHTQAMTPLGLQHLLREGIAAPPPHYRFREEPAVQCCHL